MSDDSALADAISAAGLPGAVALIADADGVRYARAFGTIDAAGTAPMREDTLFQIASMTKALVTAGALQLVEGGKLSLDAPIGEVLPQLADPQVITGFGEDGAVQTRAAARPITLRHLLTHTSGLGYAFIQPEILRAFGPAGPPPANTVAGITMPLLFDPGERWEYSVATDWAGLAIEAASGQTLGDYLEAALFAPLGMNDTAFRTAAAMPADAAKVHVRTPGGGMMAVPVHLQGDEFHSGGGGLTSTAPDYARFLRMILRGGELDGARVLSAASIAAMRANQIGDIRAGAMGTAMPDLAQPFDTFPDQHTGWTLGFLTNPERGPAGRSAGSLNWAGIFNSYYWIDPAAGVAGVFMAQLSPFGDPAALAAFAQLERMAYA